MRSHHSLSITPFLLATALLAAASPPASAGRLTPGLEAQMGSLSGDDEIKVLVVMKDAAPIRALDDDLHARQAPRAERHARVVTSLRETANRSQTAILRDLDTAKDRGSVRGFTSYWLVNAITVVTTVDHVRELARRSDVDVIEADLVVDLIEPFVPESQDKGGAPETRAIGITPGLVAIQANRVWYELGIDGTGALVGNMDTGVDGAHPALAARWRGNFAPAAHCWHDAAGFGDPTPIDHHYHGTHVMGTICGLAPNDSIGVAPGALWIADNSINQGTGSAFDNDVISALQWFSDPDGNPLTTEDVPDVVQNSWGVNEGFSGYVDCDSRWWTAIDNCEAAGVVLTWSAGNEGPGSTTMRSPSDRAASPYNCFSVGSTIPTAPYTISSFSSRGPSGCGGPYAMKPEVSAPGENIYSAEPGGGYQLLSGTSMAGPHVAGVVALMRAANPDVDVQTIKQILMDTSTDLGSSGEDNTYGHGFVNAYEAVLAVLSGYGRIEGTVRDSGTNAPLAGVVVDIVGDPRQTSTDATGFFRIPLPAGSWTLEYRNFAYVTQQQSVDVVTDETVDGSFAMSLAPQATVSGVVTDFTSALVGGASITVLNTPLAATSTNPDGTYSINVPDGGTYDIRARKDGFASDTQSVVVNGNVARDFVLGELTYEDFESGNFLVWPWESSGSAPWTVDATNHFEGAYSAKSGSIGANQASTISLDLTLQDEGQVTFYYRVDSEANYDYLRFFLDDVEVGQWSGSVSWSAASFAVGNGAHNFRWSYTKDGSVDTGADAAWLDLIDFPTVGAPQFPEVAVAPGSLEQALPPDETAQQILEIQNSGPGALTWSAALVNPSGPVSATANEVSFEKPSHETPVLGKDDEDPRQGESPLLGSGGPDAFGYRWIDSDAVGGPPYQWVEISGVGTPLTMSDDSYSGPHSIGFPFSHYGTAYTTVYISSNGLLSFSSTSGTYYSNTSIPSTSTPNSFIAGYWDDLNPGVGGTIYKYNDVANGRFIVEWNAVPHYVSGGGGNPQTFEIILNSDGSIFYQYKTVTETTDSTIGVENATGTVGLQTVFNAAYLHNNLAVRIGTSPWMQWVQLGASSGIVPGESSGNLLVDFDSSALANGVYQAVLRLTTNDLDETTVDVPVTLTVSDATAALEIASAPEFDLGFAEPNPFGQSTRIDYAVPVDGIHVAIQVFDVGGRLVRTIVDGPAASGRRTATWDGRDDRGKAVGSGVYFYRMDAGEFSRIRKMTLLR